jgi:hypothetical protein
MPAPAMAENFEQRASTHLDYHSAVSTLLAKFGVTEGF